MARASRLCYVCGDVLTGDAERLAHMAAVHPGYRVAWRDKRPWIVSPDGSEVRVGAGAIKRMRAVARAAGGSATRTVHRARVRTAPAVTPEAPEPAPPMVEHPTGDAAAPPYFVQSIPPIFAAGGTPIGPEPTADAAPEPAAVSRESIRLALDAPMLSEIIRQLSIVISEWDGAGDAGHLSRIEATQLAMLIHEPTITAVARYFGGNVDRFRLALAAAILLLGKGRVHARALAAKRRPAADPGVIEAARAATVPAASVPVAAEDLPTVDWPGGEADPIAALAARQHEWNTVPRAQA